MAEATTTTTDEATTITSLSAGQEEETTDNAESSSLPLCLICYEPLDYRALLPCDHNDVCPVCLLRLRQLHKDGHCPICKQPAPQIVCEPTLSAHNTRERFADYPIWGTELGKDFTYLREDCRTTTGSGGEATGESKADSADHGGGDDTDECGTFYRIDYYERVIRPLLGFQCVHCRKYKGPSCTLKGLQDHLRQVHRLQLCHLCTDAQRDFVANLPRFSAAAMKHHLQRGDKGTAFAGHPVCEFCRPARFYDLQALHAHLNQEHYKCHVCERLGLPNQFLKHYPSLQRHFDNQHFLCHDPVCLQARFVVFESELDLRHHERQVHGLSNASGAAGSTKIALEFRYHRGRNGSSEEEKLDVPSAQDFDYTLDGQAFVPHALTTNNNDAESTTTTTTGNNNSLPSSSSQHPLHLQRTKQLRQRAAEIAVAHGLTPSQPEAFPSLAASAATETLDTTTTTAEQPALRAGWTSGSTVQRVAVVKRTSKKPVGQVTDSAFPALPAGAKKAPTAPLLARPRPPAPPSTTYAAIQQAAHLPVTTATTTTTSPLASSSASSAAPSATAATPNLSSADQFPSLGGGGSRSARNQQQQPAAALHNSQQPYAAAQALARQNQLQQQQQQAAQRSKQQQQALPSANQFPALGGGSATSSYAAAQSLAKKQQPQQQAAAPQPPQWDNPSQFPAPQQSSGNSSKSVREKLLGQRTAAPSAAASANVLQATPSYAAASSTTNDDEQATLEDLKATLGKPKYKQLKQYTAQFANGEATSGQAYIDQVAALFEQGTADVDFWKHVPNLVESCPASFERQVALDYLEQLRSGGRKRNGSAQVSTTRSSSLTATTTAKKAPPPPPSSAAWPAMAPSRPALPAAAAAARQNNVVPGKTKAAWGGSGKAAVVRAQAPPGSVAVAASKPQQAPQSATKFMAQEQKKSAAAKNNNKKKKNELRQLAFGS